MLPQLLVSIGDGRLVEEREFDRMRKRPLEQIIVISGENLDVEGEISSFRPFAVAVWKDRRHQFVAVLVRVEGAAAELGASVGR